MARAVAPAPPRRTLVKVLVPMLLVVAAGTAFWRTVHSARSAPYTIAAATQRPWRVTIAVASEPSDPVLLLEPPSDLLHELFDQVFKRSMESMQGPAFAGMPLVLASELERVGNGRISPEDLLAMARAAGLESTPPTPHCMGHRRLPEPNTRSQAFYAIFDSPAFTTFRSNLATRLGASFDAGFVTPALFVGTVESTTHHWLPLHADAAQDCVAPIAVTSGP
jgi:hypothetical protein